MEFLGNYGKAGFMITLLEKEKVWILLDNIYLITLLEKDWLINGRIINFLDCPIVGFSGTTKTLLGKGLDGKLDRTACPLPMKL